MQTALILHVVALFCVAIPTLFIFIGGVSEYWIVVGSLAHHGLFEDVSYFPGSLVEKYRASAAFCIFTIMASIVSLMAVSWGFCSQRFKKLGFTISISTGLFAGFCGMVTTAVFADWIDNESYYGWGFKLFVAGWVLLVLSTCVTMFAAAKSS